MRKYRNIFGSGLNVVFRGFVLLFLVVIVCITCMFYSLSVKDRRSDERAMEVPDRRLQNRRTDKEDTRADSSEKTSSILAILVLSSRDSFERRKLIFETWASGYNNVYFIVAEQFCPYPEEQRVLKTQCQFNGKSLADMRLHEYQENEEEITARLRTESKVILLPVVDVYNQLKLWYQWALEQTTAKWFLMIDDNKAVRIDSFEKYLKSQHNPADKVVLGSIYSNRSSFDDKKWTEYNHKQTTYAPIPLNSFGYVVSRAAAQYIVHNMETSFDYQSNGFSAGIWVHKSPFKDAVKWVNTESMLSQGSCGDTSKFVIGHFIAQSNMILCFRQLALEVQCKKSILEDPSKYLHFGRFDVIVKMVYAYFYAVEGVVPKVIELMYTDLLRVWTGFRERCSLIQKTWCDSLKPCREKYSKEQFLTSFQHTLKSIQTNDFDPSLSQIPVSHFGVIQNGAHRLAATIVLSKNATFQHLNQTVYFKMFDFEYFRKLGFSTHLSDLAVLQLMRICQKMVTIGNTVHILPLVLNDSEKEIRTRDIVKNECSRDGGILYEKVVNVTKDGMKELIVHMYGKPPAVETNISQIHSKLTSSHYTVSFLFFFGKSVEELTKCNYYLQMLYTAEELERFVNISNSQEQNLILAEFIFKT